MKEKTKFNLNKQTRTQVNDSGSKKTSLCKLHGAIPRIIWVRPKNLIETKKESYGPYLEPTNNNKRCKP